MFIVTDLVSLIVLKHHLASGGASWSGSTFHQPGVVVYLTEKDKSI